MIECALIIIRIPRSALSPKHTLRRASCYVHIGSHGRRSTGRLSFEQDGGKTSCACRDEHYTHDRKSLQFRTGPSLSSVSEEFATDPSSLWNWKIAICNVRIGTHCSARPHANSGHSNALASTRGMHVLHTVQATENKICMLFPRGLPQHVQARNSDVLRMLPLCVVVVRSHSSSPTDGTTFMRQLIP